MYDVKPNLLIGFHGCDISVRDKLLSNPDEIIKSEEPHDWLGHGMYFWENNNERALQWAEDKKNRGGIKVPAVIGAVISLGHCFDFLDSRFINMLKVYHELFQSEYKSLGKKVPQNRDIKSDANKDKVMRELDCAVIEFTHQKIAGAIVKDKKEQGFSEYKKFDSTRGVFIEGGAAFPGAGIQDKNHIQICIRNANCIKGFFLPRKELDF